MRPQGEMSIYGQDTEVGRWPRSRGSQRQPQRQRAESACAASDQRAESACIASVQSKRAGSSTVCDVLLVTHISSVVVASPAPPPPLPRSFSSVAHHPFSQRQSAFVHPPTSRAASPAVVFAAACMGCAPGIPGGQFHCTCLRRMLSYHFLDTHRLITTSVAMHTHRYHTQPSTARERRGDKSDVRRS